MVAFDSLQFRKNKVRQPMQYAWFAATTRNFLGITADKISKKEINDLDIGSLCEDIVSEMSESQEGTRLTLYLSTMLSFGAVKLFQQQAISLQEDCQKLMLDLSGGPAVVTQKKKTKTKAKKTDDAIPEETINLSALSIPKVDITKVLDKKNMKDVHLMSEMDFSEIPEVPQSFGFNPNEREITEREMDNMYRQMINQTPERMNPQNVPQDDILFEMNDVPMIPGPVANLLENQVTPQGSPHRGWEGMKTPKPKKHPGKAAPKFSSPSEAAKTAYSPPKKRSRTTYRPDPDADVEDGVMVAAEPGHEAAFPGDILREAATVASPIFDFRKKKSRRHNLTMPLRKNLADVVEKGNAVAALLAEPPMDYREHHGSAPTDVPVPEPAIDAQVELPDVSFYDSPPATGQPKEANASTQVSNQSQASPPPAAPRGANVPTPKFPKVSSILSELSLSAITSFEEKSRKRFIRRGKKIFADRIKQVEIEPRPADFMTIPRKEALFPHALKHQPVLSLLSRPATMKSDMYLPAYRCWSDRLKLLYRENVRSLREITEKKKEKRARSRESSQQSNEQNKEQHIDNMDIVPEQREPSLPKNIDMNDEPVINVPEQRADFIPEDNRMDVETAEPTVHAPPPADVQAEKPKEQSSSEVIHDVPQEIEQPPPPVEPVFEEFRVPDPIDQVAAVMSPPKRFKSRDDLDLQAEGTHLDRCLTVDELFEIIQSCWNKVKKRDIDRFKCVKVGYGKVIKPGHYNGVEAARYLQHCLILENMKKLYLEQEIPYDIVYLTKWQPALYERE